LPPTFIVEGDEVASWLSDLSWFHEGNVEYEVEETEIGKILKVWEINPDVVSDTKVRFEATDSLPLNFASDEASPNCLGTAMLLCGFAEQTGAKYFLCSYLEHRVSQANLHAIMVGPKEIGIMEYLGIPTSPEGVAEEWAELPKALAKWSKKLLEDFHYALVIQLVDGNWMLVDPYQKTAAVLTAAYGMDEATSILEIYRDLYPGMSILCDDGGKLRDTIQYVEDIRHEAHVRAANMLAPFNTIPVPHYIAADFQNAKYWNHRAVHTMFVPDYFDFADLLTETDDVLWFESLMRWMPQFHEFEYRHHLVRATVDDVVRGYVETASKVSDEVWKAHNTDIYDGVLEDEGKQYGTSSFEEILCEAHTVLLSIAGWVTDPIIESIWGGFDYPHPVIEVMNPTFGLGLALLNQLRCWTVNDLSGTVLLCYGASQQYWHEAAGTVTEDSEQVRHIEDLVRMLPHHYPIVQNKLDYFERMRENHVGVIQEESHQGSHGRDGSVRGRCSGLQPQAR
jgi:hypothetical protein